MKLVDVTPGEAIITILEGFNSLLSKLDDDPGVCDYDYTLSHGIAPMKILEVDDVPNINDFPSI